jgi:hypothetical protein
MELMGRFMAELGLTPASRSRVMAWMPAPEPETFVTMITFQAAPFPPDHPALQEKTLSRTPDLVPEDAVVVMTTRV